MTSIHKPILIVIAGPNGSGKTTITSRLLKSEWLENAVYINPDNVAQEKITPEKLLVINLGKSTSRCKTSLRKDKINSK